MVFWKYGTDDYQRDTVSVKSYRYGIFFCPKTGGIPFTHLATRIFDGTKDPAKTVGSTFVVRAERNDIQSIKDLRGKNCAASLPDSLGGWLAALGEIKEHGFDPDNFFKTKNFRKLCKIRNFSQSPFGGFIFEESDGNFPSGRNWSEPNQSVSSLIDTIILGEANLGSIFEAISDEHVGNRGQHC